MNKHWAQSGIYRYAIAKIQIKLEIKKNFARKNVLQQKKSQNIWNFRIYFLLRQAAKAERVSLILIIILYKTNPTPRFGFGFFSLKFR